MLFGVKTALKNEFLSILRWQILQEGIAVTDLFDGTFHPLAFLVGQEENVAIRGHRFTTYSASDLDEGRLVVNAVVRTEYDEIGRAHV